MNKKQKMIDVMDGTPVKCSTKYQYDTVISVYESAGLPIYRYNNFREYPHPLLSKYNGEFIIGGYNGNGTRKMMSYKEFVTRFEDKLVYKFVPNFKFNKT